MSQVSLTKEEFLDYIMILMLESIRNESKYSTDNESWNTFIQVLKDRGLKAQLLTRFLDMDANSRMKYKRTSQLFEGTTKNELKMYINVDKTVKESQEIQQVDRELCKSIYRKVQEVRFKTSMPITDEKLDRIIDYCIEQKKKREEQNNG